MDANRHFFRQLASSADFVTDDGAHWSAPHRALSLSGGFPAGEAPGTRAQAISLSNLPSLAVDQHGTGAWVEGDEILAAGAGESAVSIATLSGAETVQDLAADAEGVLYVVGREDTAEGDPAAGGVALIDLRDRWSDPVTLPMSGDVADRVAPGGGRVWLLDRAGGRCWVVEGRPLHDLAHRPRPQRVFQPEDAHIDLPRIVPVALVDLSGGKRILDCAAGPDGRLAVLIVDSASRNRSRVVLVDRDGATSSHILPGGGFAGSIGWLSATRFAVILPGLGHARGFDVGEEADGPVVSAASQRLPLRLTGRVRFCRGGVAPAYVTTGGPSDPPERPVQLFGLSMVGYATTGLASAAKPLDAGQAGAEWHRLVLEAFLPPGAGAVVRLAADDDPVALADAPRWTHVFGDVEVTEEDAPVAGWLGEASEIPHHPGLLDCPAERNRAGAFAVLIQRAGQVDRSLRGRYLAVEIEMTGAGQASPRIAAVRAYAARFSLVENYLPPIFRKSVAGPDPEAEGPAAGADFHDRFTAIFEQQLTRIEDKAANAYLLTDPATVPEEAMEWLSGWVGLALTPGLDADRKRAMLSAATSLYRKRGTLAGMAEALDIASGGLVECGGVVVIEDFRLRRTFAAILGADYGRREDPLLAGFVETGAAIVGPSLFLGDGEIVNLEEAERAELLSLYLTHENTTRSDAAAADFFDDLAYRVTVLIHADLSAEEFEILRLTAEMEAPAHIRLRFLRASQPLILGLYSLLNVDTYLRRPEAPDPIRVGETILGGGDLVRAAGALDPRLETGGSS